MALAILEFRDDTADVDSIMLPPYVVGRCGDRGSGHSSNINRKTRKNPKIPHENLPKIRPRAPFGAPLVPRKFRTLAPKSPKKTPEKPRKSSEILEHPKFPENSAHWPPNPPKIPPTVPSKLGNLKGAPRFPKIPKAAQVCLEHSFHLSFRSGFA